MIITNFFAPNQNHSALQNMILPKITPCMNRTFQSFKQRSFSSSQSNFLRGVCRYYANHLNLFNNNNMFNTINTYFIVY